MVTWQKALLLLGMFMTGATCPEIGNAAPDPGLELQSCGSLIKTFRETLPPEAQGDADGADCGSVAAATIGATGKYPYWLGCLNYGEMPTNAHMARCNMLSSSVRTGRESISNLRACEDVRAAYESNLRAASEHDRLPAGYRAPSCENAAEAVAMWSGARSAWLRCRGYDQSIEKTHAASCLMDDPKLADIKETNLCIGVRNLYEARLKGAYGFLPPEYRALKCSNAREVIEEVARQRAALQAARQQRAFRAASQRVRVRQAGTSIDINKLIYGFLGVMQLGNQFVGQLKDRAAPLVREVEARGLAATQAIRDEGQAVLDATKVEISPEDLIGFGSDSASQDIIVKTEIEKPSVLDITFN